MSDLPTWNDVEREEAGVQLPQPRQGGPQAARCTQRQGELAGHRGARTPEDRQRRRDSQVALATLAGALDESLRPLDPLEAPAGGG